jgi:hypothetical protein
VRRELFAVLSKYNRSPHPPFWVSVPFTNSDSFMQRKSSYKYCFKKANYDQIKHELSIINWNALFMDKEIEEAVACFYEKLYTIIKQNIPLQNSKMHTYPIWFTPKLIQLFKKKNQAWIKMKKNYNQSNYDIFSLYRKEFKTESENRYKKYMALLESSIKKNIKYFWRYISQRKRSTEIPINLHYKTSKARNMEEACNLFSNFFLSVYQPSSVNDNLDYIDLNLGSVNTPSVMISDVVLPITEIRKSLKSLDISKGAGVDNIPPIFFRETASIIDKPVHYLYNKCLSDGVFPRIWKRARIVPVYKGGSKTDAENYRPISILPVLSKIFERLVHSAIYPHLHNTILQQQHGFVKKRSTVTNLLAYSADLFEGLDANTQIDSIYTDFRKAFDRVDHRKLLEKIAYNGIRGNLWRWFKSYISNRTQKVAIGGCESLASGVSSGVPQGSILGPLLFVIFINDINKCFINANFLLYADDLKIYLKINNYQDHILLQEDLDRFSSYCIKNKLELSLNKCKSISFTKKKLVSRFSYSLCGSNLEKVQSIRDLGVTIDNKLHFGIHTDNIISKAFQMYGFVMRSSVDFKHPSTLIHLFKSLIRSQLEYAVAIWNPLYKKYNKSLERVQKKFLRHINYKCSRKRLNYELLLKNYKLLDLNSRRLQLEAMLLYDLCNNKYDCINITNKVKYSVPSRPHVRPSRRNTFFAISASRTNAGIRSPLIRMCKTYNEKFNTLDIFGDSKYSFKKHIIEILTQ